MLLVWAGVLAWHVRREYFPSGRRRIAAAARHLPPGAAYYGIWQGGQRTGWAQSLLDTLPSGTGFRLNDRLTLSLVRVGLPGELELRVHSTLGPALGLRDVELRATTPVGEIHASGEVSGDTALRVVVRRPGRVDTVRAPVRGSILTYDALPLRLAVSPGLEPGGRIALDLFDPLVLASRRETFRVLEHRTRTYPDSADRDSISGKWFVAGEDTVEAWKLEAAVPGGTLRSWVDEDGRVVEARIPGGIVLKRLPFELAFYGYRASRYGRGGR